MPILVDPRDNVHVLPPRKQQQHQPPRSGLMDASATPEATDAAAPPTPVSLHGHGGLDMDEIDRTMFFTPSERQTVSCGTVTVDLRRGRILSLYNKKLGIAQLPKGRKQIGEGHLEAGLRETLEETGVRVRPLALKVSTRSSAVPATTATRQTQQPTSTIPTPPASTTSATAYTEADEIPCGASVDGSVSSGSIFAVESPVAAEDVDPNNDHDKTNSDTDDKQQVNGIHCSSSSSSSNSSSNNNHPHLQHQRCSPDTDVTSDVFNNEFIGVVRYPDPQSQTPGTLKSIYWFAATFDLAEVRASGLDGAQESDKFVVCAYSVRDTIETLRFRAEKEVVLKLVADLEASGIPLGGEDGYEESGNRGCDGYDGASLDEADVWARERGL